jgi:predicted esterase
MREHHIPVTRTARYYSLGREQARMTQLWIVCHGYGQLASAFVKQFEVLEDESILVVAPEALNRFYLDNPERPHTTADRIGATWMTREDRLTEIDDYVRYLDALTTHVLTGVDRAAVRVRVLGFSQGAAAAARWIAFGSARVDELILWGSFLPPDLDLAAAHQRMSSLRLTLITGTRDKYASVQAAAEHESRLRDQGFECRRLVFDGGHRLDNETLRTLAAENGRR